VLETAHTSGGLAEACAGALNSWRTVITDVLVDRGVANEEAAPLATLVLASIEGGLLLARAYRSSEPLVAIGNEMTALLRARVP
jgi:TetR/AcrR family transcriptional repressor of lmrAB and yxaGH operons